MGLYLYRSFIRPANSLIVSELLVYGLSAGETWPFAGRKATNGTAICRKLSWGAPKQPNMVLSICLFIVGLLFPVQKYRCTATIHVAEKLFSFHAIFSVCRPTIHIQNSNTVDNRKQKGPTDRTACGWLLSLKVYFRLNLSKAYRRAVSRY